MLFGFVLPLRFGWLLSSVFIRGLCAMLLMCTLFITKLLWLVRKLGSVNRFNHTSWVTVVTPTDSRKSARNGCEIDAFGGGFVLPLCFC